MRNTSKIIVYLFEENGFPIVFMGPNSGLAGCYKSYTFGLSPSQPIIGQGEYFELFASFINFESLQKDDIWSNLIKLSISRIL